MMTQVNQEIRPRVPHYTSTLASCLRDFTRMNPPMFYGSRMDEDPQNFLDEICKILLAMGVTMGEKADLAAYQLKNVA